jgi:hypothetical protein
VLEADALLGGRGAGRAAAAYARARGLAHDPRARGPLDWERLRRGGAPVDPRRRRAPPLAAEVDALPAPPPFDDPFGWSALEAALLAEPDRPHAAAWSREAERRRRAWAAEAADAAAADTPAATAEAVLLLVWLGRASAGEPLLAPSR